MKLKIKNIKKSDLKIKLKGDYNDIRQAIQKQGKNGDKLMESEGDRQDEKEPGNEGALGGWNVNREQEASKSDS